jgi:hypothetical protein
MNDRSMIPSRLRPTTLSPLVLIIWRSIIHRGATLSSSKLTVPEVVLDIWPLTSGGGALVSGDLVFGFSMDIERVAYKPA